MASNRFEDRFRRPPKGDQPSAVELGKHPLPTLAQQPGFHHTIDTIEPCSRLAFSASSTRSEAWSLMDSRCTRSRPRCVSPRNLKGHGRFGARPAGSGRAHFSNICGLNADYAHSTMRVGPQSPHFDLNTLRRLRSASCRTKFWPKILLIAPPKKRCRNANRGRSPPSSKFENSADHRGRYTAQS